MRWTSPPSALRRLTCATSSRPRSKSAVKEWMVCVGAIDRRPHDELERAVSREMQDHHYIEQRRKFPLPILIKCSWFLTSISTGIL